MTELLKRFARSESGETGIEYAIIAAFISLAIIAGLRLSASHTTGHYTDIAEGIRDAKN